MTITHDGAEIEISDLTNEELFVVAVFADTHERRAIDHELEKRATKHRVYSLLGLNSATPRARAARAARHDSRSRTQLLSR